MNRRRFLGLAAGGAAGGILGASLLAKGRGAVEAIVSRIVDVRLDVDANLGLLTEDEMRTILALAEVLVPPAPGAPAWGTDPIRDHVNRTTSGRRGYLPEYRKAVRLLQRESASTSFADRTLEERDRVVEAILWRYSGRDQRTFRRERFLVSKGRRAFRAFVVHDLLQAYYRSPVGWAIVGYGHYPGSPAADPRDYTRPPKA
jgi:hypothetical protein